MACYAAARACVLLALISNPTNTIDAITPSAASVSRIAVPDIDVPPEWILQEAGEWEVGRQCELANQEVQSTRHNPAGYVSL